MSLWPGERFERELYAESFSDIYAAFAIKRIGPFWTSIFRRNESSWHLNARMENPNINKSVKSDSMRVSATAKQTLTWTDEDKKLNALCYAQ
jgi:uncharacterized protein (DUF736 family)